MKHITCIICIIFYFLCFSIKAQSIKTEFKIRYEAFVKGDIKIIGNNIVNREDRRNNSNIPFDDRSRGAKLNDELNMQYIDVDDDPTTFSSSSASFSFEGKQKAKVIYAGLYWTATYPYTSGTLKGTNYGIKDGTRENSQSVMIKTPSRKDYVHLQGELIYDGSKEHSLKGISPYVYYVNISYLLTNTASEGEYTVANIRAATGHIAGGSAAGWALVLVYENEDSNIKKIITYDGFESISNEPKTFSFSGFTTPSKDAFQTRIMGITLEGDFSMGGDQVTVSVPASGKSLTLESKIRPQRNFFNSAITWNDEFVRERNPASQNTLGFDIFKMDIPNVNQELIPNDASSLDLTYSKSLDRYYLFFTALEIENNPDAITRLHSSTRVTKISAEDVNKGYYIVVGVFLNQKNVKKRIQEMQSHGYKADTFHYKEQVLNYVYLEKYDSYEQALKRVEEIKNEGKIPDPWILDVENYL
ncbi:SPOR domain-containing protein [Capnocytophaga canis]|uniref:SPOR domain-containing protein n=1 Tax=Capnocytophaga canis TaxID=1848903 RepID=UPI0015623832|nr:SPOR domain-containing protein [Capnocytophaga canis]